MKKTVAKKPVIKSERIKKSLPKAQFGKSKVRTVDTNQYGSSAAVEKNKKDGSQNYKLVEISNTGSSMTNPSSKPTARIEKIKYDSEGMQVGNRKVKNISVDKAQRKINRITKKVGRNENDSFSSMKKGGVTKTAYKKGGVVKKVTATKVMVKSKKK